MYFSTARIHLPPYSKKALFGSHTRDLFPQRPNLRAYIPTKARPDPCPAPSGDPAPPPFVVFPGPSSEDGWPHTSAFPALPRSGQARARASYTPTASSPTSGWCRRWRRVPRQREPYKMATAARASARPGAFSRASSRTRECALPASPPPLAGAGRPILRPHTNGRPRAGAGSCGDGTAERRSARPQPRLANHCPGRGSRFARQKGSGSNHCLGETVSPGGVSNHHNGSCY